MKKGISNLEVLIFIALILAVMGIGAKVIGYVQKEREKIEIIKEDGPHYKEHIMVTAGFYKGQTGTVVKVIEGYNENRYVIILDNKEDVIIVPGGQLKVSNITEAK